MTLRRFTMRLVVPLAFACAASFAGTAAIAAPVYFNGFETDTASWTGATRVASGTGGIASADGNFHGQSATTAFTQWGGYNYGAGNAVPTAFQAYRTSLDIYLDVGAGFANNTRFDFSSAINNSAGIHKRDFVFNAGFYDDATGPGASTNRFVISASNNSQPGSAFAKNPARDPIAISTSGWYTFEHYFYEDAGALAVDMIVYDAGNVALNTWTLTNPLDAIAGVGGNRYGWFDFNQFASGLAFDNAQLELVAAQAVPEPTTLALAGLALVGLAAGRRRHHR